MKSKNKFAIALLVIVMLITVVGSAFAFDVVSIPTLLDDTREIYYIQFPDGTGYVDIDAPYDPAVCTNCVDEIVAYEELGQVQGVPWFALVVDDIITVRVNAAEVMIVVYKDE